MSRIKIENSDSSVRSLDAEELGRDVVASESKQLADFLIGFAKESTKFNWESHCIQVASEMDHDEAECVLTSLLILTAEIRQRAKET